MSYVPIPNLPAAINLTGAEMLEAVQAGTSVRITTGQIATQFFEPVSITFANIADLRATSYKIVGAVAVEGTQGALFYVNTADTSSGWTGTASIAGNTLTSHTTTSGALAIGQQVANNGAIPAWITAGSGTTWTLSGASQTIATGLMTADSGSTIFVDLVGDRWYRIDSDSPNIQWAGAVGNNATVNTDSLQGFLSTAESGFVPQGIFVTKDLSLGDPATATNYSPSGQAPSITSLSGTDNLSCVFAATAGTVTVLKRHNVAGMQLRNFGVDGRSIASYGVDLFWDTTVAGGSGPSNQLTIENVRVSGALLIAMILSNNYDSKLSGLRLGGPAPIALQMVGGQGSITLTDSALGGVFQVAAQTANIVNTALLGGLDINGAADNLIGYSGEQIFPILAGTGIASYKVGVAIDATDAAAGAALSVSNAFVLGGAAGPGAIQGKFLSGDFRDVLFDWNPTNPLLINITGAGRRPFFRFTDCFMGQANDPYTLYEAATSLPYDFSYDNVVLANGTRISSFLSTSQGTWTPTIVGSTTAGSATTYSTQLGKWKALPDGLTIIAYFDVAINVKDGTMAGAVEIGGVPFGYGADPLTGAVCFSLINGVTFTSGYTQLTASPQAGTFAAALFQAGSGQNIITVPAANITNGCRLAGFVTYSLA